MNVPLQAQQLLDALQEVDMTAQLAIEDELLAIGPGAIAPLVAAMLGPDDKVCYKAAHVLAKMAAETRDPSLVDPMCEALHSPQLMVRQVAAQVLGMLGDCRAVMPLIEALKDEKPLVQLWAAESLGRLGDPGIVAPLVKALKRTDAPTVRYTIIRILGGLGDPSVLPVILKYQDDENHHVRARVRDAVKELSKQRPTT